MSSIHLPPADILLDPEDWYVAGWRNLPPLPRPDPAPFDLADCCKRLARVKKTASGWDWSAAQISPCLGPEEGRFWLDAFERAARAGVAARLAEKFARRQPLPPLSRDECLDRLQTPAAGQAPAFLSALASQLDAPTLVEVLLDSCGGRRASPRRQPEPILEGAPQASFLTGFRRSVRPRWSADELEAARHVLRDYRAVQHATGRVPTLPEFAVCLMASLNMFDEVAAALADWEAVDWWGTNIAERQFAVFGLGDPAGVVPELRRLGLRLARPGHVRGLLAHLEAEAIPLIRDAILDCPNRPEAEQLTSALCLVLRPETAPAMLALTRKSRGPAPAQRWLDEHRPLALSGLLGLIDDEQHADAVLDYLRNQVRAGHQALIDEHLARLAPDARARVRRSVETTAAMHAADEAAVPDWFPTGGRKPRLPTWLDPATLPAPRIDGKRLPVAQVTTLLALLRDSALENPPELFARLRGRAEPRLLDAFAWAVFERWLSASADAKDKWALTALGHLGGDGVCLPLASLVGQWPGKSQHQRATHGLQCLEAIGTPLALLCIHRLEQTSRYPGLKMEAEARIEQLARRQKLSVTQFEDRTVPDLGLDGDGYRPLDYAGRAFRLTLGTDRQARLLDDRRQYLGEFPELAEADDPARVEAARAEWNLFKLQAREVVQIQMERLEKAMLRWRRWKLADFEAFLVRHPLMNHLSRALLWGAFETISKPRLVFRVTEGRACVDAAGSPAPLDPNQPVGVLHPVLLAPDERMVWSDVLTEQGVELPAWQMPRETFPLAGGEKDQQALSRWEGRRLDYEAFCAGARCLGFESGAHQRSRICCRVQYFQALNLTVYLLHTPIPEDTPYEQYHEPIELFGCQFRPGDTRSRVPNVNEALPLGTIDPVLLDEVIGGMEGLTRTARTQDLPRR